MGDAALQARTYQKAADIADRLLAAGLPVVKFKDFDGGAAVGIAFDVRGKLRGARMPVATASFEGFADLYEALK